MLDLDDTLFHESDFARSGFAAVGAHLENRLGVSDFASHCERLLKAGSRGRIFDQALAECGHHPTPDLIEELVDIYRSHKPSIQLPRDTVAFLEHVAGLPTALISDGPARMQRNKVVSLGLDKLIDKIVLTGEWPDGYGKPHPRAYGEVMQWSGRIGSDHVYIADNGSKDFIAPRALGWKTVQILRPGRVHDGVAPTAEHEAEFRIASLDEISLRRVLAGSR
ncbi:HAD family hydrolase [Altererythrobacter sp. Root672]|uniref:HAD family hydrolase n=1 Tax=Altererythrobacter sp. Root672 TaxID=1736584 RepID=UPI00138EFBE7|nr:HAD family hydrolase [Altererythrobacter sp. Root672]